MSTAHPPPDAPSGGADDGSTQVFRQEPRAGGSHAAPEPRGEQEPDPGVTQVVPSAQRTDDAGVTQVVRLTQDGGGAAAGGYGAAAQAAEPGAATSGPPASAQSPSGAGQQWGAERQWDTGQQWGAQPQWGAERQWGAQQHRAPERPAAPSALPSRPPQQQGPWGPPPQPGGQQQAGAPQYGRPPQQQGQAPYGQYGAPAPQQYGQPPHGQQQHGSPAPQQQGAPQQYGQPPYGQPPYGQQYGQPQYPPPQYGQQPQYGQPQFAPSQYGQQYGQDATQQYGPPASARVEAGGQGDLDEPAQNRTAIGAPPRDDDQARDPAGPPSQPFAAPGGVGLAQSPPWSQGHGAVADRGGSTPWSAGQAPGSAGPPAQGPAGVPGPLATWPTRVVSYLVDAVVPSVIAGGLVTIGALADSTGLLVVLALVASLAQLAFVVWNSGYRQGRTGQSIGKRIAGTTLVGVTDAQPIGFVPAVARQLLHVLDGILFIGYLRPLWDEKRQTFADTIMGSVVVRTGER